MLKAAFYVLHKQSPLIFLLKSSYFAVKPTKQLFFFFPAKKLLWSRFLDAAYIEALLAVNKPNQMRRP